MMRLAPPRAVLLRDPTVKHHAERPLPATFVEPRASLLENARGLALGALGILLWSGLLFFDKVL
ncbi:MAG: hypothetical protein GY719_38995 [bacterium]|nr:hypothetical protein [bacterium]